MSKFNEFCAVSHRNDLLMLFCCFLGGTAFAAALPPLNWEFFGFVTLLPLLFAAERFRWKGMILAGFFWGLGWALFAYRFLREIEPVVPFLIAPVLAIWPAFFAAFLPFLRQNLLIPAQVRLEGFQAVKNYEKTGLPWYRMLFYGLAAAAFYTLVEWTRSRLFVWNDLSITQYRDLPFIRIASVTGSYGVLFLTALGSSSVYALLKKRGRGAGVLMAALIGANFLWGSMQTYRTPAELWNAAAIQGDLSQRRHSTQGQFQEALEIYLDLSRRAAALKPEIILWPESAVPMPLRSSHPLSRHFARELLLLQTEIRIPMLIGAIDFADNIVPGTPAGVTNSALYFEKPGKIAYKYDKIHRVPYGEYIPFRNLLPQWLIDRIDMGRDLTPGDNWNPLELSSGVRAGIAICYEGVFGYLTREFARRGANVLVVLSNDAWYPESSEPEQHLANAVMRSVETGLPMLRCGNNGGTGTVLPDGSLAGFLDVSGQSGRVELKRGRAFGVVPVHYRKNPEKTFYVRYGEWFVALLALLAFAAFFVSWENFRKYRLGLPPKEN